MYRQLEKALEDNNLNKYIVSQVGKHIMSQSLKDKKFCIFHFVDGIVDDIKWYEDIETPCLIMMNFLKEGK